MTLHADFTGFFAWRRTSEGLRDRWHRFMAGQVSKPTGTGLHLNIDDADNRLDFQLARDVAPYFQLNASEAEHILQHVLQAVAQWQTLAEQLKIPRAEQQMMESAFRYT